MALKLDNNLIEELGLGALPEQEKQLLLRQIYEKLEMNVGVRLADQMSNEQLDEFEKFVDSNDDKGAFQWLESNFPNYKDVVNEEFEKLKAEISRFAPQMLAIAAQNAQASQAAPAAGPGFQPVPGAQAAPTGQAGYAAPGYAGQPSHNGNSGQPVQPVQPGYPAYTGQTVGQQPQPAYPPQGVPGMPHQAPQPNMAYQQQSAFGAAAGPAQPFASGPVPDPYAAQPAQSPPQSHPVQPPNYSGQSHFDYPSQQPPAGPGSV